MHKIKSPEEAFAIEAPAKSSRAETQYVVKAPTSEKR